MRGRARAGGGRAWGHIEGASQTRMTALGFVPSAHVFLGTLSPVQRMRCGSTKVEAVRPEQDRIVLRW